MGDGRIISMRPKSLRKVCSFKEMEGIPDSYKKIFPVETNWRKLREIKHDPDPVKVTALFPLNKWRECLRDKKSHQGQKHIDGILQDEDTGELLYFIADQNARHIEHIEEGSKVEYEDAYDGLCEVILHKRAHEDVVSTIKGDVDLGENGVVVRYVKVTDVVEGIDQDGEEEQIYKAIALNTSKPENLGVDKIENNTLLTFRQLLKNLLRVLHPILR